MGSSQQHWVTPWRVRHVWDTLSTPERVGWLLTARRHRPGLSTHHPSGSSPVLLRLTHVCVCTYLKWDDWFDWLTWIELICFGWFGLIWIDFKCVCYIVRFHCEDLSFEIYNTISETLKQTHFQYSIIQRIRAPWTALMHYSRLRRFG